MDPSRFDSLLRTVSTAPTRRVAVRFAVGAVLGGLWTASATPADAKKGGKGKGKGKKKRRNQSPSPPPCSSPCPTCQACNAASGLCVVQPNGQAGQACAAPKVCCGGACCDPIHQCNSAGTCATCSDVCPVLCHVCINLADGSTTFGDGVNQSGCVPCTPNNPCSGGKKCVTSYVNKSDNIPHSDCGPVGSGFCSTIQICA